MMISLILLGLILLLDNDSGAAVGIVCIFSVLLYVFGEPLTHVSSSHTRPTQQTPYH